VSNFILTSFLRHKLDVYGRRPPLQRSTVGDHALQRSTVSDHALQRSTVSDRRYSMRD